MGSASGAIHPVNSRMVCRESIPVSWWARSIWLRYSRGVIWITAWKWRLKLETEANPTISDMVRMDSSVLRSRLQAFMIRVLFR